MKHTHTTHWNTLIQTCSLLSIKVSSYDWQVVAVFISFLFLIAEVRILILFACTVSVQTSVYVNQFAARGHLLFLEGFEYHQRSMILSSQLFRYLYQIYCKYQEQEGPYRKLLGYVTSNASFTFIDFNKLLSAWY